MGLPKYSLDVSDVKWLQMKPFQIQLFVVLLQFKPEPFEPNQKFRFKSLLDWTEKQVWGSYLLNHCSNVEKVQFEAPELN